MIHGRAALKRSQRFHRRPSSSQQILALLDDELRSPMATALKEMDAVEEAVRDRRSARAYSGLVCAQRQLRALDQMMRQVLELHTLAPVELRRETVDLAEVARRVVSRLVTDRPSLRTRITSRTAPGVIGWWDRLILEEIVQTLLGEAVEAGEERIHLAVIAARRGGRLVVCGAGPVVSALVRHLVEAHGGRIRSRSRPTGGTTVEIWLPRALGARERRSGPSGPGPTTISRRCRGASQTLQRRFRRRRRAPLSGQTENQGRMRRGGCHEGEGREDHDRPGLGHAVRWPGARPPGRG
jgi:signal transduction histidine kinase